MDMTAIIVAVISLLGTLGGSLGGIVVSNRLTNYKIEQIERKLDKLVDLEKRTVELEKRTEIQEEKIKVANNRIADLERKEAMFKVSFERNPRKKPKKKTEFSKKWLVACITASVFFTAASYILSAFDKQPLETLSGTIIETLWGASGVSFIGYAVQNSARAFAFKKLDFNEKENENDSERN